MQGIEYKYSQIHRQMSLTPTTTKIIIGLFSNNLILIIFIHTRLVILNIGSTGKYLLHTSQPNNTSSFLSTTSFPSSSTTPYWYLLILLSFGQSNPPKNDFYIHHIQNTQHVFCAQPHFHSLQPHLIDIF